MEKIIDEGFKREQELLDMLHEKDNKINELQQNKEKLGAGGILEPSLFGEGNLVDMINTIKAMSVQLAQNLNLPDQDSQMIF